MAIYAIFNVAIQFENRKLANVRMRGLYVEKVYYVKVLISFNVLSYFEWDSKVFYTNEPDELA